MSDLITIFKVEPGEPIPPPPPTTPPRSPTPPPPPSPKRQRLLRRSSRLAGPPVPRREAFSQHLDPATIRARFGGVEIRRQVRYPTHGLVPRTPLMRRVASGQLATSWSELSDASRIAFLRHYLMLPPSPEELIFASRRSFKARRDFEIYGSRLPFIRPDQRHPLDQDGLDFCDFLEELGFTVGQTKDIIDSPDIYCKDYMRT